MKHTDTIHAAIGNLSKAKELVERDLKTLAEMRETLPKKEAELENLKKVADVRNNSDLSKLSQLHWDVELIKKLLESEPPKVDPDVDKLLSSIDFLNSAICAAGCDERNTLIEEVTKLLVPYAGSSGTKSTGDHCNPAREIARGMPILGSVLCSHSPLHLGSSLVCGLTPETRAANALSSAEQSLLTAKAWLNSGGKFATYLR